MNIKDNKRKQRSKENIEKAFFELLKTKEMNQVKVTDICKLAKINRSTFYASYLDVYDLADKICASLKHKVDNIFDSKIDINRIKNDFLKLLKHIKANQELYLFYFKLGYEFGYNDDSLFKVVNSDDERLIEYRIIFFKNGFNAIVQSWLKNGCLETPELIFEVLLYEYRGRVEKR